MNNANFNLLYSNEGVQAALGGSRYRVNKKTGHVQVRHTRLGWVNSLLRKDEWEELDAAVVGAATQRLNGIAHLVQRNQVKRLGGIGTLVSQFNTASQMTAAAVTIHGESRGSNDRVDFKLNSVPVPVIHKEYYFSERELEASRTMGNGLETGHAEAAARVVAESLESMLFLGNTSIVLNGAYIYGYTTHPNRNTGSATGDWGTAGNAVTTVANMIASAQGDNHFGPYYVYAATTQYNEAANIFFTDGSGQTQLDRIKRLAGIAGVFPSDWLTAGTIVLVQMQSDVADLAYVPGYGFGDAGDETGGAQPISGVTNLEWMSGDGLLTNFKTLTIAVPRVKDRYDGKSGIVHFTGA